MVDGADPPPHPLNWRGIVVDPSGENAVEVAYWAPPPPPENCISAEPTPKTNRDTVSPPTVNVQVQPLDGVGRTQVPLKGAHDPVNPAATIVNLGPHPEG